MADDGQRALFEGLTAQGFEVELKDTGWLTGERYICYLVRRSLSKGYFGAIEVDALEKAADAVAGGRFRGEYLVATRRRRGYNG